MKPSLPQQKGFSWTPCHTAEGWVHTSYTKANIDSVTFLIGWMIRRLFSPQNRMTLIDACLGSKGQVLFLTQASFLFFYKREHFVFPHSCFSCCQWATKQNPEVEFLFLQNSTVPSNVQCLSEFTKLLSDTGRKSFSVNLSALSSV